MSQIERARMTLEGLRREAIAAVRERRPMTIAGEETLRELIDDLGLVLSNKMTGEPS